MFTNFETYHLPPLFIALPLFLLSIILFQYRKNWGLVTLVIASLVLGFFMANLDPFLNTWDEQQHAVVAKNMMTHPFKPMLYADPLYSYDHSYWIGNHIWLHKQPLFLWQMAASMKIFGANVLAVRLPSILMHALIPYFIYRIGKRVTTERAGFIAAFTFALLNFPLELVAGRYATDHNDVAFLFYVCWSIMCLVEFHHTKEKKWLYFMGIAAGCAVLVKWLIGLFVFGMAYIIQLTKSNFKFWKIREFLYLLIPLTICLMVFLPWQIYIFNEFPLEAGIEFKAAASHFGEVVEGHSGDWTYHFVEAVQELYGSGVLIPWILLLSFAVGIWQMKQLKYRLAFAIGVLFIYIFFTLAATKMIGFTLIVMPLILICLGITIDRCFEYLEQHLKSVTQWVLLSFLCVVGFFALDIEKIGHSHARGMQWFNAQRHEELQELDVIIKLREDYSSSEKVVIFNANMTLAGHVQFMFFTDFVAYPHIPDQAQIDIAKEKGYTIVILNRDNVDQDLLSNPKVEVFEIQS